MMMKTLHILLPLAIAALPTLSPASGVANAAGVMPSDSIKNTGTIKDSIPTDTTVHQLREMEIKGRRSVHQPGRAQYFTTRKERNASADATALLRRMHIPELRALPFGITSASGISVSYFINGMPATDEDMKGMNMKDVRSVVCLDNPSEARYLGKPYVVDFIVQEYEYGGYTKLYATAWFPSLRQFAERLNSKFTYRRMTYDIGVFPVQTSYRFNDRRGEETYRLNGGDVIRTIDPYPSDYTSARYPVQVRAIYRNGMTTVSNRLGYGFTSVMRNMTGGTEAFSNDPGRVLEYSADSPQRSNTIDLTGNVTAQPHKLWAVTADYNLKYTHYNNYYSYVTNEPFAIDRQTREDAFDASATLRVTRTLSKGHSVYVSASGSMYHSLARYYGDTRFRTSYTRGQGSGRVGYSFRGDGVYVNAHGGFVTEHSDINGTATDFTSPYGYVSLSYNPTRTHNLNAYAQYSIFSPMNSSANPAVTRVSKLMYITGNPDVKPYPSVTAGVSYTWDPGTDRLWLNLGGNLTHLRDRFRMVYYLSNEGDAVIRGYANTGDCTKLSLTPSATLSFLNKNLWVNLIPTLDFFNPGKGGDISRFTNIHYYLCGTLYLGNFNVELSYYSPRKYANPLMDATFKTKPYYSLKGGWANSVFNVTLSLVNIFNRSWESDFVTTGSPVFEARYSQMSYRYRQNINIDITYTFSYGKKIRQRDNLDGNVTGVSSNVGK